MLYCYPRSTSLTRKGKSQVAACCRNFGPIPAAPVWRPSSREIAKLEQVRALLLPLDLFAALSPTVLKSYRQRMSAEEPYELRRHALALRATLLAAYCHLRGQEITDNLVDLLIDTVHRIGAKAEERPPDGEAEIRHFMRWEFRGTAGGDFAGYFRSYLCKL